MIGPGSAILQAACHQAAIGPAYPLFDSAEVGGWWDPSDMSTLWQDTAGTIPVTASGQACHRMDDKSGRGFHLYRLGASTAPTFRDVGGLRYLEFNGTTDRMATVTGAAYGTGSISIFAAVANRNTAATGWRGIVELSTDFTANNNTFTLGYTGAVAYMGSRNSVIALAAASGIANNTPHVLTGLATTNPANCQIRKNGLITQTNTANQGTLGFYIAGALHVGTRGPSGNPAPINLYGLIVRGGQSSEAEIQRTEEYLAGKANVVMEPIFTKFSTFLSRDQFARDAWDAQIYGSQILQDPDGTYKMFYVGYTADGLEWGPAMAKSTDLMNWEKPLLGNLAYPEGSGNTDNNLIIWHTTISPLTEPKYDLVDVTYAEGKYIALCMNQATATTQIWESVNGETGWTFVTNAFTGVARGLGYAEPKSIVYVDGVYRIYYAEHGTQRRSIGFYEAPTLGGTYVDQGLLAEFTSVAETLQYYDIRHWQHDGNLWACVTPYNNITQVLGPNTLYRSDDGGLTHTRIGIMIALGDAAEWDDTMVTVAKPFLVNGTWYVIYTGSDEQHNTWPRQMEQGFAWARLKDPPW